VASFLKRVPLLRDLPAHHALEQARFARWHALAAGDVLLREGEREVRLGERTIAVVRRLRDALQRNGDDRPTVATVGHA
jgi:hypothetical protein